jgi:hypothetical protein
MRLADLQLAQELSGELARLDEIAGPAELQVHDCVLVLNADETADFVEWKRQRINAQLRALGVDIPQPSNFNGFDEIPEGRSGTAREAPSTGMRDGTAAPAIQMRPPASVGVQPAAQHRVSTIEEARELARDRLLSPIFGDMRAPLSDDPQILRQWREDVDRYEERRRPDIEALAQQMLRPPPAHRCELRIDGAPCGEPATTLVAGEHYCTAHAKTLPRPAAPEHLRLVG